MKTGIYWQDPKYAVGRHDTDPSCVLYLPLHRLDGASFMSKDAYGHLCTVTGALWTPKGRSFDGVDDYINCGSNAIFNFTSGDFTLGIWYQATTFGDANYRLLKRGSWQVDGWVLYAAGVGKGEKIFFETNQLGASQITATAGSTIAVDTFYHIMVTRSGTSVLIYLGGVDATDTEATHTNPATCSDDLEIGTAGAASLVGRVGEVWIYNRALTPLEIMRHFLATKWRYR